MECNDGDADIHKREDQAQAWFPSSPHILNIVLFGDERFFFGGDERIELSPEAEIKQTHKNAKGRDLIHKHGVCDIRST